MRVSVVVCTVFVMMVVAVGLGRGPEWVAQVPVWSVMMMLMSPRAMTVGESPAHATTVCVRRPGFAFVAVRR